MAEIPNSEEKNERFFLNFSLSIPNYSIVARHDRNDTQNGRGGGLLIYVNEKLQSTETSCQSDFNQYCSVQIISTEGSPIHIYPIAHRIPTLLIMIN